MKQISWLYSLAILVSFISCEKETTPSLTTIQPIVTDSTIITGGIITDDGNSPIKEKGVCFDTIANPTIQNSSKININSGNGSDQYKTTIEIFKPNTVYYVRAYATNSKGTAYGQSVEIKTNIIIPQLTTKGPTLISSSSVTSGGSILKKGGGSILEKGVCWSSNPEPTINDNKVLNNTDTNNSNSTSFECTLNNLEELNIYYLRAYVINEAGVAYGDAIRVKTQSVVQAKDYDGNIYNTVKIGNQVWFAENLRTTHYSNGDEIQYISSDMLNSDHIGDYGTQIRYYNYYDDSISNSKIYGNLYNLNVIKETRNVCPIGWHVPSLDEWNVLIYSLGGLSAAGGKMKDAGDDFWYKNIADNSSGFGALGSGGGSFGAWADSDKIWHYYDHKRSHAFFATSTWTGVSESIYIIELYYNTTDVWKDYIYWYKTVSVRCLKN